MAWLLTFAKFGMRRAEIELIDIGPMRRHNFGAFVVKIFLVEPLRLETGLNHFKPVVRLSSDHVVSKKISVINIWSDLTVNTICDAIRQGLSSFALVVRLLDLILYFVCTVLPLFDPVHR